MTHLGGGFCPPCPPPLGPCRQHHYVCGPLLFLWKKWISSRPRREAAAASPQADCPGRTSAGPRVDGSDRHCPPPLPRAQWPFKHLPFSSGFCLCLSPGLVASVSVVQLCWLLFGEGVIDPRAWSNWNFYCRNLQLEAAFVYQAL